MSRLSATVHVGADEPLPKCVPEGAFAKLTVAVYVPGATDARATEAVKATNNIDNAVMMLSRLMFLVLLTSPVCYD
jgi:hypothetical protein